jgi:hypothetical protein
MKDVGRNDPCPCGSGKKYKNCCLNKPKGKIKAKWLNAPAGPNLLERTFGEAIAGTGKVFEQAKDDDFKKIDEKPENGA